METMNTETTQTSQYRVMWAAIALNSKKKVFKYQINALDKLGFRYISRYNEVWKHYFDISEVFEDSDNINKAMGIISERFPSAQGTIINDKQMSLVPAGTTTYQFSTEKQKMMFRAITEK